MTAVVSASELRVGVDNIDRMVYFAEKTLHTDDQMPSEYYHYTAGKRTRFHAVSMSRIPAIYTIQDH